MNIEDRLYKTAIKAKDFTKKVARDDMIKKTVNTPKRFLKKW